MKRQSKRMKKRRKIIKTIICIVLAVILLVGGTFGTLYYLGKKALTDTEPEIIVPENVEAELLDDGNAIIYNGHKYRFNNNIISVLVMGIDRSELDSNKGVGYNGQADANFLCALDTETNTISLITINRDTLAQVNTYTSDGEFVKTKTMQLCLGYAYGDGKEKSCENMVTTVSRLLCNIPISLYASIDEEAVAILNDKIGGVEVPEYKKDSQEKTGNTITLYGNDAYEYVQERSVSVFDSNLGRVSRQKEYISAFANKAISETKKNITLPVSLYNTLTDYMITNIKVSQVSYIVTNYIDKSLSFKNYSIDGKLTEFDGKAALEADTESLFNTVLSVFYTRVS